MTREMAIYGFLRPLLFALDAERAHRMTIAALKTAPYRAPPPSPPGLAVRVAGIDFANPVGLAAGFDKDAEVTGAMLRLGFGFVEAGTLTPLAQGGNPKPRLFRLAEDGAVINRMGFNNRGLVEAAKRLEARDRKLGVVGINIGANKDSPDRIGDYARGARMMAPLADYLTVNISSPNTPGLRELQGKAALGELLDRVIDARGEAGPPLFLKLAPDLEPGNIDDIAEVALARSVDALIVGNTTVSRPPLRSRDAGEIGGLSGSPLAPLALQRLKDFRTATGGRIPLIAAGGIASAEDAWKRIRAGASLVQLYTALAFEGPGLVRRIVAGLDRLREEAGIATIADAVGSG